MPNKKLLVLDDTGAVKETVYGYDATNYSSVSYPFKTLVVDSELPDITVSYGVSASSSISPDPFSSGSNTGNIGVSVVVSPLTEQVLTGTVSGAFALGEEVFQSTTTPEIVNNYMVGGATDSTFVPVIGTIGVSGEIGLRAAQFKGTYNDLAAQKACGLKLPAFVTGASTPYLLVEGWIYFEQEPSNNYDPILITRSADGLYGSTNDSFRLEYDTSSDQVQFHYSDSSYASAGYQGIVNVSPSGISTGKWNHFAVAWASSGGSASIKTYWNGTALYSVSGLSGSIRNSTAPLMVGSGISGDYPLKGWLEDVHIRAGGVTLALADYAYLGATASNVFEPDFAGDYTIYLLSMNGPIGSSFFPADNLCRVTANVAYSISQPGVLGVSLLTRETTSVHGITLFNGVCGGFTASGGSGGKLFGFKSGACMNITGVNQLVQGISAAQAQRVNSINYSTYFLYGITAMRGSSGSSGDLPKLFSSGWTGQEFSFLPTQSNINSLRNVYDNYVVSGYTGNTIIDDYNGNPYYFGMTPAKKLYEDVLAYRADAETLRTSVVGSINSSSSVETLRTLKGFTTGIASKLALYEQAADSIFIPSTAKLTKLTVTPESKNLKRKDIALLEPFEK